MNKGRQLTDDEIKNRNIMRIVLILLITITITYPILAFLSSAGLLFGGFYTLNWYIVGFLVLSTLIVYTKYRIDYGEILLA